MIVRLGALLCLSSLLFAPGLAHAQTTVLSEDFETGFPGSWSVGDSDAGGGTVFWARVNSAFGSEGTHSGSAKAYCAGMRDAKQTRRPRYAGRMLSFMSRDVQLAGYSNATLRFWYKIPSIRRGDSLQVFLGTNMVWNTALVAADWTLATVNLASYVGDTHALKVVFASNKSGVAEGAYLDDITLMADEPGSATTNYFLVAEFPGSVFHNDSFVIPLTNAQLVAHARDLIARGPVLAGAPLVFADIAAGADGVNRDYRRPGAPAWSWHVTSVLGFGDVGIELYDGWPTYVEQDVAGWIQNTQGRIGFWSYTVVAELPTVVP